MSLVYLLLIALKIDLECKSYEGSGTEVEAERAGSEKTQDKTAIQRQGLWSSGEASAVQTAEDLRNLNSMVSSSNEV